MKTSGFYRLLFAILCLASTSLSKPLSADVIDIGIFSSSEPNKIDIKIRPDFFIPADGIGISEIRYTVRWPESSISIENFSVFPYLLSPVGSPVLHEGHFYQVFANPNIINPYNQDIYPMEEVVVASFEYSGGEADYFEILIDDWTQANNGNYFVEYRGSNYTGSIYQPIVSGSERLLDIKVFLEGAFSSSLGHMRTVLNNENILPYSQPYNIEPWVHSGTEHVLMFHINVVDWLLIEFIDAPDAEAAASSNSFLEKALLVKKSGEIVNQHMSTPRLPLNHIIEHNLFVIVRHRNHIDIMSNYPLSYNSENKTYSYDFSSGIDKVFGGSAGYKMIDSDLNIFGMVTGDTDGDGEILPADRSIFRQHFGISGEYNPADFDFDGEVLPADRSLFRMNFGISNPLQ
jgi:hypothetical protein